MNPRPPCSGPAPGYPAGFPVLPTKILAKTIDFYLIDLRSYHVNLNYNDLDLKIFINSLLKRIVVDIKRRNDEINTKEKRSITKNVLLKLLEQINVINLENCNLHAFFLSRFRRFSSHRRIHIFRSEAKKSRFRSLTRN